MKESKIVIIGAGIAGVTCAIYLKRANADFVILDSDKVGGKLRELKDIENYPGFSKCSGEEIAESLEKQLDSLNIHVVNADVQTILKEPEGFRVVTSEEAYIAKAVVLATGYKLNPSNIPGEKENVGRGVSYCATCDGNFFKNDNVAVVGNNNNAFEEALYLTSLVNKLYFVCPDDELIGHIDLINQLKNSNNVEIITGFNLKEIQSDDFGVTSIILLNGEEKQVHGVFNYTGSKSTNEIIANISPTVDRNEIPTDENMMSDVEGFYAIGDIRKKPVKQLVTAASDGAIAAQAANRFVKNK